jgi:tellurite resistance protein TerC
MIESTDVIFAVDSIPAAFAVTTDPFLVFTSNVFAILGLRSLYFALEGLIGRFRYLKVSLMLVLLYIGLKMLASHYVTVSNPVSLLVIVTTLVVGIFASMARAEAPPVIMAAPTAVKMAAGTRGYVWRVAILVTGLTTFLTGVLVVVRPVARILVIGAGLAILAAEFAWARRWMRRTRDALTGIRVNRWGRGRRSPDDSPPEA